MNVTKVEIDWHSGLSIYASEAFLRTAGDEYGWVGAIDDDGLLCVLPFLVIRKAMFRLIRFPTHTIPMRPTVDEKSEREFLNKAMEYFRAAGADVVIPPTVNTVFRTYPDGAKVAPYGSHILDLTLGEEKLWSMLHSKHRNNIRNATKKGVTIHSGPEHIHTAFELVKGSFSRSSKSPLARLRLEMRMNFPAFERQTRGFGENVKILVASFEGVPQAAVVLPFSHHSAYYMHGGSIASPLTGAMNLLLWEAIRTFSNQGVRSFDFCGARIDPAPGSKAEGIIKFKERFGGVLKKGYTWKYPLRPVKYYLYSQATRLRSGGDVVDQEGHKMGDFAGATTLELG